MQQPVQIVFIGAGRLATQLSQALYRHGYAITQVYSRTEQSARSLAECLQTDYTTSLEAVRQDADVYIYAVCDSALAEVVRAVHAPQAVHLHTAGSMSVSVFGEDKPHAGVLYPFQSFTKGQTVDFQSVPILTEATDSYAMQVAKHLAESLSDKVYEASAESRGRLHLAGVFANNFVNCMYALAAEQLEQADLPFELLLPLIRETAQKVQTMSPRKAQTGPAVRHDTEVMQRHLHLLTEQQKEIYSLISKNIQDHEN